MRNDHFLGDKQLKYFFWGGNFHPDPSGFHDDSNLTISYVSHGLVQPSTIPWFVCNF